MNFKKLKEYPIENKRVLLRVDYNITLKDVDGKKVVGDDTRIVATLPTIRYLLEKNCSIVILTHFKRPEGKVVEELRVGPMAQRLSELLGQPVQKLGVCIGKEVQTTVKGLHGGDILMLENVRFYPQEKDNDEAFAKELASYGDVFVFDAFATAHRDHASVTGIATHLDTVAGFLVEKEIEGLDKIKENPQKPYVALLGGVKISDKVSVIKALIEVCDSLLIGGALANTFLLALGKPIGASVAESESMDKKGKTIDPTALAKELYEKAKGKIVIASDFIAAPALEAGAPTKIITIDSGEQVPDGWKFLDIGPKSIELFSEKLQGAQSIFWNGPMGAFEIPGFGEGTQKLGNVIANKTDSAVTITGGGDTEAAVTQFGLEGKFTHSSTAGGASLKFLAGKELPIMKYLIS